MLDSLITSKTRIKLLLKFFLNTSTHAYLRGLADEFGESTNALRLELNHLENAGLLKAENKGNRKVYHANSAHPLVIAGKNIDVDYFENLIQKAGKIVKRQICYTIILPKQEAEYFIPGENKLLVWTK